MQDELHLRPGILSVHEQVPGLRDHPRLDRVPGGSQDAYPTGAVLYNGKDAGLRSVEQAGGEEVQRQDSLRLGRHELGPARSLPAGRGIDAGVLEDLPDRGRRHGDAEPGQLAMDAAVTPRFVLPGKP
ncbi:MAG: hypothetical protein ACLPKI_12985 [Streptosporangiaceae bacterium]